MVKEKGFGNQAWRIDQLDFLNPHFQGQTGGHWIESGHHPQLYWVPVAAALYGSQDPNKLENDLNRSYFSLKE